MSRILRDLEVRNLIHRRADPKDGRAALISLTATGWAALNQVGAQSEEIYRAIELRIGSARLNRLMETLTEIESDLDDMRSAEG